MNDNKAYNAGVEWAKSLRVGDVFTGYIPEANLRYPEVTDEDGLNRKMFGLGAWQVLKHIFIYTGEEARITHIEDVPKEFGYQ